MAVPSPDAPSTTFLHQLTRLQSKEADKATRYVALLYEARCNNRWHDIPELSRKVEKHASARRCLTLAARSDALLHLNPTRQGCTEADEQYGEVLSSAIRESANAGDVLDASTVHAALFHGKGDSQLALTQVPESLHRTRSPTSGVGSEAWLAVCVLRGSLIRGLSFEALGNEDGATTTYRSIIAYISRVVALDRPCLALREAAEELITHVCLYFATASDTRKASMGEAMAAFHVLSQLLSTQSGKFTSSRGTFTKNTPHQFWRIYYTALSSLIKAGFVYHPSPLDRDHETLEHTGILDDDDFIAARKQQRTDLRRVEQSYEAILLSETKFPKANESNEEIKAWLELVVTNWRILCGSAWSEEELGQGGKAAVGRSTLDILYRAQTKTFHSTQILRYLVTVHAYLAEFDLAFKAFDSYIEILTKGKARAKKTGSAGLDLDDDETALNLASEAVRIACRFGSKKAAKKAFNVGQMLEHWLEHGTPDTPLSSQVPVVSKSSATHEPSPNGAYPEAAISSAYRAIGISQAQWAKHCHDPEVRKVLLENAVQSLRTSLRYRPGTENDSTETFFALGHVYAELGRLEEATTVVGFGLNPPGSSPTTTSQKNAATKQPGTEQPRVDAIGLLPLHHLHALLLSAGEDFDASALSCEEALEKAASFGSSKGTKDAAGSFHVVASTMESYDKQSTLEIKMTQIQLASILGGPERAVNASNELIALYSQLFGPVVMKKGEQTQQQTLQPRPKSSSGTIRSIFSRRSSRRVPSGVDGLHTSTNAYSTSAATSAPPSGATSALPSRPQTMATAPAIHVIDEAEEDDKQAASTQVNTSKNATPRRSLSLQNRARDHARQRLGSRPHTAEGEKPSSLQLADGSGVQAGGAQPLEVIPHNLPDHEKTDRPAGHIHQPPQQDTRLPVPPPRSNGHAPPPQFLHLQDRRFRTSLLIKIWLFIGNLYKACSLYSDADDALEEARSLVEELELAVSTEEASVKHMQEVGWGGGRSVEDLWADVAAERGNLLCAQGRLHEGLLNFEKALTHQPNHVLAVTGLANLLLDIYEEKIPSERPEPMPVSAVYSAASSSPATANGAANGASRTSHAGIPISAPPASAIARLSAQQIPPKDGAPDTLALYRTAARDRAYGLLSSITTLPEGTHDSNAWLGLARAHELSGQAQEARAALWRVVELEDVAPVRPWANVGPGGYVLW